MWIRTKVTISTLTPKKKKKDTYSLGLKEENRGVYKSLRFYCNFNELVTALS